MTRRVRRVAIAESQVMGRLPILNLATALAVAALVQLVGVPASGAITQAGGQPLTVVWSTGLITAAVLVWVARLIRQERRAVLIEVAGIGFICISLAAYLWALLSMPATATTPGIDPTIGAQILDVLRGRLVVIALLYATITNCLGRVVLLLRRQVWATKVST